MVVLQMGSMEAPLWSMKDELLQVNYLMVIYVRYAVVKNSELLV